LSETPADEDRDDAGPEIAALREAVVHSMEALAAASRVLATLFERLDVAMATGTATIRAGSTAADLAVSVNLPGRREQLNEAAAQARSAQHALFRALFRLAAAEGAPKAEIARTWRVSRQLVSRMIKEPD